MRGLHSLVLIVSLAVILSGCTGMTANNIRLTYDPVASAGQHLPEGMPKIYLDAVENKSGDGANFTAFGHDYFIGPNPETMLREALEREFGRLGSPLVKDRHAADVFLRASLVIAKGTVDVGLFKSNPVCTVGIKLSFLNRSGMPVWEDTLLGESKHQRSESNMRVAVEKAFSLAFSAAIAKMGGSLNPRELAARLADGSRTGAGAAAGPSPSAPLVRSDVDNPGPARRERPDDFAVVVGIGRYSDIPEAQFAERDAEAIKNHLLALGIPSRNLIHLSGEKAVKSSMEKFLETWLPKNVSGKSRVFFFFSGHGAPDLQSGQAFLLPYDGDPGFLENTGYPIKRLYEKLSSLKAKEVIVAMDACFSGAGGRSVLAKGARPLVMKVDTATVPQKLTVFAAASGDQITSTLEDQGHGTFTYYFLKGLSGGAKDDSGAVTARALYDYLKPKIQDAARRQNRDQEPVLHGQGDRELVRF
ncbi:MAG: caspase family protein [Elusimicrobiota bacterium]